MEPELTAEAAYVFRHGALRDAAYQLITPTARARLHQLVLDILEEALGANLAAVFDLAEHARLAQLGAASSELPLREMRYLRLAATHAAANFENDAACRLWERVAAHPAASANERADALGQAGVTHWMLGRRAPAERCLSAAIKEGRADPRRVTFCLIERGTLYRDVREYDKATQDLETAYELARRADDKHLQLRALGNLCTVRDIQMSQSRVRDLYAPVLKLARQIGDARAIGITEGQIGLACMRGGDFAKAERHLEESVRALRQAGDKLNVAAMLSSLGTLFRDRTDGDRRANLERAAECFHGALSAKDELGFVFQRANALTGLAGACRELGRLSDAAGYAREAYQLAMEVGDPDEIAAAERELRHSTSAP